MPPPGWGWGKATMSLPHGLITTLNMPTTRELPLARTGSPSGGAPRSAATAGNAAKGDSIYDVCSEGSLHIFSTARPYSQFHLDKRVPNCEYSQNFEQKKRGADIIYGSHKGGARGTASSPATFAPRDPSRRPHLPLRETNSTDREITSVHICRIC